MQDAVHQADIRKAAIGRTKIEEKEFFLPVGMNFLVRVLRMDSQTIRTRLRNAPVADKSGTNRSVWYFHEVLPYLVKPKMTAEQFARTLNKADLPPEINSAFWAAQRSRIKFAIESGEAWATEDVIRVMSDACMTIGDTLKMSVEEMRQRAKLTDAQSALFEATIDDLRATLREKLVEMPQRSATGSLFGKPLFGIAGDVDTMPDIPDDFGDDDEDEA